MFVGEIKTTTRHGLALCRGNCNDRLRITRTDFKNIFELQICIARVFLSAGNVCKSSLNRFFAKNCMLRENCKMSTKMTEVDSPDIDIKTWHCDMGQNK